MAHSKELAAQLSELAEKMGAQVTFGGGSNGSAWAKKPDAVDTGFLGVSVPIKVQTPRGSVRAYVALPAEVLESPDAFQNAILRLIEMGIPVDIYEPKQNNWNGGNRPQGGGGGGGNWGGGNRRW